MSAVLGLHSSRALNTIYKLALKAHMLNRLPTVPPYRNKQWRNVQFIYLFKKVIFFAFRICTWKQTRGGSPPASTHQTSWLWVSALRWGSLPRRVTTATSLSEGWRCREPCSTCTGQSECLQLNRQLLGLQTSQERHTRVHVQCRGLWGVLMCGFLQELTL